MSQSAHSARLHALAAGLCALLLLVALGIMDANRAPWWALLGVQGALLVATASAGIWLDRAGGERRWGDEAVRSAREPLWRAAARAEAHGQGRPPPPRAGVVRPGDDDVFWQERLPGEGKEER